MRVMGPIFLRFGGESRGNLHQFLGPQLFGLAAVVGGTFRVLSVSFDDGFTFNFD